MTRVRHQIPVPEFYGDPDNDRIWCALLDCDNPASSLFTSVECFRAPHLRNHSERPSKPRCPECRRVAFCCVQHMKMYEIDRRTGEVGRLPAGVNSRFL